MVNVGTEEETSIRMYLNAWVFVCSYSMFKLVKLSLPSNIVLLIVSKVRMQRIENGAVTFTEQVVEWIKRCRNACQLADIKENVANYASREWDSGMSTTFVSLLQRSNINLIDPQLLQFPAFILLIAFDLHTVETYSVAWTGKVAVQMDNYHRTVKVVNFSSA